MKNSRNGDVIVSIMVMILIIAILSLISRSFAVFSLIKQPKNQLLIKEIITSAGENGYSIHVVQHTTNNQEKTISILKIENNTWTLKAIEK